MCVRMSAWPEPTVHAHTCSPCKSVGSACMCANASLCVCLRVCVCVSQYESQPFMKGVELHDKLRERYVCVCVCVCLDSVA